jgi:hypothetical protein
MISVIDRLTLKPNTMAKTKELAKDFKPDGLTPLEREKFNRMSEGIKF